MEWPQIFERFGLPMGMLLVALITGARGLWVWGREHKDVRAQRDEYKGLLFAALDIGDRSSRAAETAVRHTARDDRLSAIEDQLRALRDERSG